MKKLVWIVVVASGVMVSFVGVMRLRAHHARLRQHAAAVHRDARTMAALEAERAQLKTVLAQRVVDGAEAEAARQTELERLRREVSEREQRADEERHHIVARPSGGRDALEDHRDPTRGFVRTEHFQNIGRATPGPALQTIVWAATKGDEEALANAFQVTGAARVKAEALLAGLPSAARDKYPTPEKLAALFFSAEILAKTSNLRITGEAQHDATHATVCIRPGAAAPEIDLPMAWTAGGWQMIVSERQIQGIERQLRPVARTGGGR